MRHLFGFYRPHSQCLTASASSLAWPCSMCGALAGGAGAYVRAVRALLLPVVVQGRRPGNKSIMQARLRRPPDVGVDPAPMRRLLRKPCGAHSESRLRVRRRFLDAVTAVAVSRARFTRRCRMSRSESFSPACSFASCRLATFCGRQLYSVPTQALGDFALRGVPRPADSALPWDWWEHLARRRRDDGRRHCVAALHRRSARKRRRWRTKLSSCAYAFA